VEYRYGRAWPDLLRCRQQSVCLSAARRNTYAYTNRYGHGYCNTYSYGDSDSYGNRNRYSDGDVNSDGNGHTDSYSYVNAYGNSTA
jgi:hypothetical protein